MVFRRRDRGGDGSDRERADAPDAPEVRDAADTASAAGAPGALEPPDASGTFDDELERIGFRPHGSSRRGGKMWVLAFNRYLTFVLHDYQDAVVLTWAFALGEFVDERGWRSSMTDLTTAEIYPKTDVKLPLDVEAIGAEITRVLRSLRLDLGAPEL